MSIMFPIPRSNDAATSWKISSRSTLDSFCTFVVMKVVISSKMATAFPWPKSGEQFRNKYVIPG